MLQYGYSILADSSMIHLEPLQDIDFMTVARWNEDERRDFLVQ